MNITSDWHIHSRNSCDDACLTIPDLIRETAELGVLNYGLTDHIHTPYNLPDLVKSRAEFLAGRPSPRFHFGVEVSCVSQWELREIATGRHKEPTYGLREGGPAGDALTIGITEDDIKTFGIEYVVAGVHWTIYVPKDRISILRDYHRQNMFLATHPLVNIVAHPWWWCVSAEEKNTFAADLWFDDFKVIPESIHDEFAAAVKEHGKVVELNFMGMLLYSDYPKHFVPQYLEYLAGLKSRGVALSLGSDCHSAHYYETDFEAISDMLDEFGFVEEDFWRLPPRAKSLNK